MINSAQMLCMGLFMTFDPSKGEGWTETILAIMFVGLVAYLMIAGKEIPEFLKTIIIMIAGLYFGFQSGKNYKNTPANS